MLKEKNSLLILKIKNQQSVKCQILRNLYESLYLLFDSILDQPIENIWYECIIILLGNLQLIAYIFNRTVSKISILFYLLLTFSFIQFGKRSQY